MKSGNVCVLVSLVLLGCAADVNHEISTTRAEFSACPILPEESVTITRAGEAPHTSTLTRFYGTDCGVETMQVSCTDSATTLLCVPGSGANGWTRETFTLLGGSDVRFDYVDSSGDSFSEALKLEAAVPAAAQ